MLMLDEGSPQVKQRMVTNLFTKMMTMLEEESADDLSGLRDDLASLVSEMRVVPVPPEEQPEAEDDGP
jgi:hypothetical protein